MPKTLKILSNMRIDCKFLLKYGNLPRMAAKNSNYTLELLI